jgi:hypothetical protein
VSKTRLRLAYGVRITVEFPLTPSRSVLDALLAQAESRVGRALAGVVKTSLSLLPGVRITVTDSKTQLRVEEVVD